MHHHAFSKTFRHFRIGKMFIPSVRDFHTRRTICGTARSTKQANETRSLACHDGRIAPTSGHNPAAGVLRGGAVGGPSIRASRQHLAASSRVLSECNRLPRTHCVLACRRVCMGPVFLCCVMIPRVAQPPAQRINVGLHAATQLLAFDANAHTISFYSLFWFCLCGYETQNRQTRFPKFRSWGVFVESKTHGCSLK